MGRNAIGSVRDEGSRRVLSTFLDIEQQLVALTAFATSDENRSCLALSSVEDSRTRGRIWEQARDAQYVTVLPPDSQGSAEGELDDSAG